MIVVALLFVCILFMTFVSGFSLLDTLHAFFGDAERRKDGVVCCFAGLTASCVYAEVWSLFGGVGLSAQIVWLILCLFLVFCKRKKLRSFRKEHFRSGNVLLFVCLLFLFAYASSHGYSHYDTGLYHAQAIRWVEEAGIVKGLGNLHNRLAYNSAFFPLTAFYSFSYLGIQSFHVTGGLMAMLLALQCADIRYIWNRKTLRPSDGARLAAIWYLFNIFDEIISPASDYAAMITVFSLVIFWLQLTEDKERDPAEYLLLFLFACFALTLKLSAACMVLTLLYPLYLLREKKRPYLRTLLLFFACAVLIVLPFLIRNVLLSGYLLYPFPALDLFDVPWKIPGAAVRVDAAEIGMYARGSFEAPAFFPPGRWIADWWRALAGTDRLMLVLDVLLFFGLLGAVLLHLIRKEKKGETAGGSMLPLMLALYASLLLWFFNAPMMRYGFAFVYLPACIFAAYAAAKLREKLPGSMRNAAGICYALLILLFFGYKSVRLLADEARVFSPAYLLTQEPYEHFDTVETTLADGIILYLPAEGDRTGYDPFPAAPFRPDIRLLGDVLTDGIAAGSVVQ